MKLEAQIRSILHFWYTGTSFILMARADKLEELIFAFYPHAPERCWSPPQRSFK